MQKTLPFDEQFIRRLTDTWPTPFYVYDEAGIRRTCRELNAAFAWSPGFREYFAVKALPNPWIVRMAGEEGLGADCSSLPELILSERVGLRGEDLMFTSNNTLAHEYRKAVQLGAIVNLDDLTHIDYLREHVGLPELLCFRYNPGSAREGNVIIGKPEEAKYGFTEQQLFEGYRRLRDAGVQRFGLHTMVASNELNGEFFVETARMLFDLALRLHAELGIRIEFVNLGHGYLVTTAVHHKSIYRDYVGVDACMANLMRPGMYGAYHHITVLGKENAPHDHVVDVVGSLCENNDKFAVQRSLPAVERGDLLVIHDSGAHGHAMGFQYNGKLRCAELLLRSDGSIRQIRRAETAEDYFATLDFAELNSEGVGCGTG